jgi:hypothetical protein
MDLLSTSPTAAAANDLFAGVVEGDEESPRSAEADPAEQQRYSNPWDHVGEGDGAGDEDEVRSRLPALLVWDGSAALQAVDRLQHAPCAVLNVLADLIAGCGCLQEDDDMDLALCLSQTGFAVPGPSTTVAYGQGAFMQSCHAYSPSFAEPGCVYAAHR